jgi:hypothetical protein
VHSFDWNAGSDTWQILDYKTSDTPTKPANAHRRQNGEWVDLQLPLYRHLAQSITVRNGRTIGGEVELGYVQLPKDVTETGIQIAKWSDDDLASADETAREVIRGIWRREFWPMNETVPKYTDFGAICQDGLLERSSAEEVCP